MRFECERCGEVFVQAGRGRSPRFCSDRCRQAAHRAKRQVFPARMTRARRWVRADGKRPVRPDGSPASSTDPATWSSFSEVRGAEGFGICLGDGLACWDLDDCIDGDVLADWAAEILAAVDDPLFVERSVSGRGLHIFVLAPEGTGRKVGKIEFYSRGRFIRTTGDKWEC